MNPSFYVKGTHGEKYYDFTSNITLSSRGKLVPNTQLQYFILLSPAPRASPTFFIFIKKSATKSFIEKWYLLVSILTSINQSVVLGLCKAELKWEGGTTEFRSSELLYQD